MFLMSSHQRNIFKLLWRYGIDCKNILYKVIGKFKRLLWVNFIIRSFNKQLSCSTGWQLPFLLNNLQVSCLSHCSFIGQFLVHIIKHGAIEDLAFIWLHKSSFINISYFSRGLQFIIDCLSLVICYMDYFQFLLTSKWTRWIEINLQVDKLTHTMIKLV